jgi:hypothetical protein
MRLKIQAAEVSSCKLSNDFANKTQSGVIKSPQPLTLHGWLGSGQVLILIIPLTVLHESHIEVI